VVVAGTETCGAADVAGGAVADTGGGPAGIVAPAGGVNRCPVDEAAVEALPAANGEAAAGDANPCAAPDKNCCAGDADAAEPGPAAPLLNPDKLLPPKPAGEIPPGIPPLPNPPGDGSDPTGGEIGDFPSGDVLPGTEPAGGEPDGDDA